ncbi:MAG: nucleotidyltransferase family protein [Duodenibacillus sp.]|nr:nucleotidyltransferase family protein [Duodenibacillus sp.]
MATGHVSALILAAGRGKRLRPYTDATPKPLLPVRGRRLCDWQLAALKRAGVTDVVMNTAHLADAFEALPAELAARGLSLALSREGGSEADALESLGGVVKALPLLTRRDPQAPFIVAAGDVVHGYDFRRLLARAGDVRAGAVDGHLVAVPNPPYHPQGDMTVGEDGRIAPGPGPHTYGCLMIVSPRIFAGVPCARAPLFPWLWRLAERGRLTAEVFGGFWANVGSPADYEALQADEAALAWADF